MYKCINRIPAVSGFKLKANWYEGFETLTDEGHLEALREAWAKCITKAPVGTAVCSKCDGRGYAKGEAVGCTECFGTGRVECLD